MSLFFEIEGIEIGDCKIDFENHAKVVIDGVLDYLNCPYECEISVLMSDDSYVRTINLEQRNIDKSTDVLSFPMVEWEKICDFETIENDRMYFHPDSGELMLGDVVISFDTMLRQAKEYEHSILREYSFLLVHSLLHLLGYDHMEETERESMESIQDEIMNHLGISRDC